MKTLHYNVIIVLLPLFLLASCKEAKKSIEETLHPKPQKRTAPATDNNTSSTVIFSSSSTFSTTQQQSYKSIFESEGALDSIQQELRNMPHLIGKKLFFLQGFYFYDYQGGMISIDLQDPDKPENVDTYTYSNGEWQMQKPVQITGNFALKSLLMSLDEVKFSTAKKVYDIAVEKSKTIEDAGPINHVYFNQIKVVHVKEWYIMINGARHNYRVKFDVNGKLMSME
ncbi:hypothetical protein SAMN05518672_1109 [Chitinophaga sp. CF118]|uniref:hypothetical protein n=1 Tax=Chitinophaga sp. CF118 TaxID=1884367 RepID=UPI0008F00EAD|nr:hypothetical protein [Chitinophaga sp. CF118]SFE76498.1 hypothetical protein SAMN05518672_1109 [Chitinophaga sp. CF118]